MDSIVHSSDLQQRPSLAHSIPNACVFLSLTFLACAETCGGGFIGNPATKLRAGLCCNQAPLKKRLSLTRPTWVQWETHNGLKRNATDGMTESEE
uniref:Secreted protein n=1 Tax=Panagrellus redivivus TaxID=6233 RepID=A0A7E4WCJ9_PANRE